MSNDSHAVYHPRAFQPAKPYQEIILYLKQPGTASVRHCTGAG